jgi:hypothetical protein
MKSKNDEFYINAFSLFVSKFDCSAHQIQSKCLNISCHLDSLKVTNHKVPTRDGLGKVIGPQYANECWFCSPSAREIHPFIPMLEGRYTRTHNASSDIEQLYDFLPGTIMSAFEQGYYDDKSYRDCFKNNDYHWSMSAAFNVGRHFLNKYFGLGLPCTIPIMFRTRGIIK